VVIIDITDITLLPEAYKLYENNANITTFVENDLEDEKYGFRKGKCCINAIFTIQQIVDYQRACNI
jgi:hypothetical protein